MRLFKESQVYYQVISILVSLKWERRREGKTVFEKSSFNSSILYLSHSFSWYLNEKYIDVYPEIIEDFKKNH